MTEQIFDGTNALNAIFEHIDKIEAHKNCDAIIQFMLPDAEIGDFDNVINNEINNDLENYEYTNEEEYVNFYEESSLYWSNQYYTAGFTVNGNDLIFKAV